MVGAIHLRAAIDQEEAGLSGRHRSILFGLMRARLRLAACVLAAATVVACSNPLGRQYEYDEQTYLAVDGSATVVVNSSLPALVALRGASLDPKPDGPPIVMRSADVVGRLHCRQGRPLRTAAPQVRRCRFRRTTFARLEVRAAVVVSHSPGQMLTPDGLRFQQTVARRPAGIQAPN
jgi:hypothetical protein